jgi:hypothetical protein
MLIDPDQSNAAVTDTRELIGKYSKARKEISKDGAPEGYFRTEVQDVRAGSSVWSPLGKDLATASDEFQMYVDAPLMRSGGASSLGDLFDVLYGETTREMDLSRGFRGVPAIGTIFMNRLREETFFQQLLSDAHQDADSVFCAIGTIFGGTGAAGLPVVARALRDGWQGRAGAPVPGSSQDRIGGILLLPYFTLPVPAIHETADGGPRPEASIFAQSAAAALPTYFDPDCGYGAIYAIGDDVPREQEVNELGGDHQRNAPHYVEMFGALGALDFAAARRESADSGPIFRITAVTERNVGWQDLPLSPASKCRFMGGLVAMSTYLRIFRPGGRDSSNLVQDLRAATFLQELGLESKVFRERGTTLDAVGDFFMKTWDWLNDMRASTPSLRLAQIDHRSPTEVRIDEILDGRRDGNRRPMTDDYEVFRFWNRVAKQQGEGGFTHMLEVMREGSELVVDELYPNLREGGAG